ncbi:MAG: spore coat protein CotJB [Oscillospiraceae bacterium]
MNSTNRNNEFMRNHSEMDAQYKTGELPCDAPLAVPYVAFQRTNPPRYEPNTALERGTLFPGLDLPFMNIINTGTVTDTPLAELMALDFACHELVLYLDTHANDKEAFSVFQGLADLAEEARRRYTALYGPVSAADLANESSFTWLKNPWPWNYSEEVE